MQSASKDSDRPLSLNVIESSSQKILFQLSGHLSAKTAGQIWEDVVGQLETVKPGKLLLDLKGLQYCDMTGVAFFQR